MNNILVILLRYLGDVLLATPVLNALRRHYPDAKITMLVNEGTETMLSGNSDVDDVLVIDRRGFWSQGQLWLTLRRRGFDCVIDLTDGDRSALLTRLTGARVRIGYNREGYWRGLSYRQMVPSDRAEFRSHQTSRVVGLASFFGPESIHSRRAKC